MPSPWNASKYFELRTLWDCGIRRTDNGTLQIATASVVPRRDGGRREVLICNWLAVGSRKEAGGIGNVQHGCVLQHLIASALPLIGCTRPSAHSSHALRPKKASFKRFEGSDIFATKQCHATVKPTARPRRSQRVRSVPGYCVGSFSPVVDQSQQTGSNVWVEIRNVLRPDGR